MVNLDMRALVLFALCSLAAAKPGGLISGWGGDPHGLSSVSYVQQPVVQQYVAQPLVHAAPAVAIAKPGATSYSSFQRVIHPVAVAHQPVIQSYAQAAPVIHQPVVQSYAQPVIQSYAQAAPVIHQPVVQSYAQAAPVIHQPVVQSYAQPIVQSYSQPVVSKVVSVGSYGGYGGSFGEYGGSLGGYGGSYGHGW